MGKSPNKKLKDKCDSLWAECIKRRAGYECELTGVLGNETPLAAHHIAGKPNYKLRYNLDNGICIDNYKMHIWGVHNKNNPALAYDIQCRIIKYIGLDKWKTLTYKGITLKEEKLIDIKIRLEKELAKYE